MIYKFDEFFSINNVLRKYYKKQQYIKKSWNFCRVCSTKTMETYCVNCKKYTATKNLIAIKSKQKRLMLFSNWFMAREKQLLSKTKNSTILIIFEMNSLK